MERKLLKALLSIPSFSGKEKLVREFIINWSIGWGGIEYRVDEKGNLFLKKGNIENAPCVVAHMDTVHQDQAHLVDMDKRLKISKGFGQYGEIYYAHRKNYDGLLVNTGCGGDDKAGIFIALSLMKKFDNIMAAFFVEEEIGCNGSRYAKNDEWLNQAGWFMQFDAPFGDWTSRVCSRVELFDDKFAEKLKPVWDKHELKSPNLNDPFTDVKELKLNYPVCCINYFAGYMDMHSKFEFVALDYVKKAIKVGEDTIKKLGNHEYLYKEISI